MGTQVEEMRREIERLEKRVEDRESKLRSLAAFIRPGMAVWYEASPGKSFAAVVAGEPGELGSGQIVVALRDLDDDYCRYNDSDKRNVKAAATWCLRPREVSDDAAKAVALPHWQQRALELLDVIGVAAGAPMNLDDPKPPVTISQFMQMQRFIHDIAVASADAPALDVPTIDMMRGLVRAAEFKEQENDGKIWDDECRKALDEARRRGWGKHKIGSLAYQSGVAEVRALREGAARIVSAIPGAGPLPSVVDSDYVEDVLAQLGEALHGDRSMRRGREAEELRRGIEQAIEEFGDGDEKLTYCLRRLLDNVNARDSLAFLEQNDADATRYRRLRVLGVRKNEDNDGHVMVFTNLDAFVDADLKAHPSRGEAEPAVLSNIDLEHERDAYRAMLCDVVSAMGKPHPSDEPTRFAAHSRAVHLLKNGPGAPPLTLHELAKAAAGPGQTVISGSGGKVERVEHVTADSMDAVHEAHRILIARRAAALLAEWRTAIESNDLPRTNHAVILTQTRQLLEDVAGLEDRGHAHNRGSELARSITDLRKAVYCLSLEVPREIYNAFERSTEHLISLIPYAPSPPMGPPLRITEESGVHKGWYAWRPSAIGEVPGGVLPELFAFIDTLCTSYWHDPFTVPHAMAAAALAAARTVARAMESRMGKISGGAAGFVPIIFVREFNRVRGPFGLRFYEEMLYPQNHEKFRQTIDLDTFRWLQDRARENLGATEPKDGPIDPAVEAHWRKIVDGEVPFGFQIRE